MDGKYCSFSNRIKRLLDLWMVGYAVIFIQDLEKRKTSTRLLLCDKINAKTEKVLSKVNRKKNGRSRYELTNEVNMALEKTCILFY